MLTVVEKVPILQYRSLIWNFAQRDLRSRYKGTAMGWTWSLMVPLATLGMYTVIFGVLFRSQAPNFGNGHQAIFAVWLFVGLVAFNFFANGVNTAISSMLGVGGLLTKVYFPPYAPVIGSLIAVGFQSLIELSILLVVLSALGNISWTWLLVPLWMAAFFAFVGGLALICAVGNIYLRDLGHLVTVVIQLLFFATPIMYTTDIVPSRVYGLNVRFFMLENPFTKFIDMLRNLIYDLQAGSLGEWLTVAAWACASLVAGGIVSTRYGRDLGEQL